MKSGTLYEQGEIVLVPFPFSNLKAVKKRPVLILSKNKYDGKSDDIITCGITSNLKDADNSVLIENKNLTSGNIPVQSRIKADKLFTLEKYMISKRLGRVNTRTFEQVKKELLKII